MQLQQCKRTPSSPTDKRIFIQTLKSYIILALNERVILYLLGFESYDVFGTIKYLIFMRHFLNQRIN